MLFASSSLDQAPSTKTISLNFGCLPFEFPPLRPRKFWLLYPYGYGSENRSQPPQDYVGVQHSLGITLQSTHACLSTLLVKTKLIWLERWPLIKVTK
jgi:hypothetical protein